jgi:hypothetical protein
MQNFESNNHLEKDIQVKSRARVADHGEVFTAEREVGAMLDLVEQESERIDSRFLEPACGNGNFLVQVLKRKLATVLRRYGKSQIEFERNSVLAVSSIYGVDILEDNAIECRKRLSEVFHEVYSRLYGKDCKEDCYKSVNFILKRNILLGDALDFTNPNTKAPIVFSEWSVVNGNFIKRRDFVYRFLVEKSLQFSLFNDQGEVAAIDDPVKDYPLTHFLKLATYDAAD